MVTSDFRPEVEIRPFRACAMKNMQYNPYLWPNCPNFRVLIRKSGSMNTMVTSDFRPEVEIRPFRACAMHPAIITGTVRSLLTWLWGRYHVPQNAFLVFINNTFSARPRANFLHQTCIAGLVKHLSPVWTHLRVNGIWAKSFRPQTTITIKTFNVHGGVIKQLFTRFTYFLVLT